MKSKDLRQNGFSPYSPPTYWNPEPQEFFITRKEISRVQLEDDSEVICDPNKKYFISLGMDHGYYPGDSSPEAYLVEFEEIKTPNKQYERQLKKYEKDKVAHEENVKSWEIWKKVYDTEEEERQELELKKQYLKLKKRFEKNDKKL